MSRTSPLLLAPGTISGRPLRSPPLPFRGAVTAAVEALLLPGARVLGTSRHGAGAAGAEAAFPGLNKDEQFGIAAGGTCACSCGAGCAVLARYGVPGEWWQEKLPGMLGITTGSVLEDALAWQ